MKKRINLFLHGSDKINLTQVLHLIKSACLPLLILSSIALIFELGAIWYYSYRAGQTEKNYQSLSGFIKSNSNLDRKIKYFIFKKKLLDSYLSQDARAYEEYEKLLNIVVTAAPYANVTKFSYESGEITATIDVNSYENLLSLLDTMQSDTFLQNFSYLKVEDFNAISASESQENSQLSVVIKTQFQP